jgi:hypothetical protein
MVHSPANRRNVYKSCRMTQAACEIGKKVGETEYDLIASSIGMRCIFSEIVNEGQISKG